MVMETGPTLCIIGHSLHNAIQRSYSSSLSFLLLFSFSVSNCDIGAIRLRFDGAGSRHFSFLAAGTLAVSFLAFTDSRKR